MGSGVARSFGGGRKAATGLAKARPSGEGGVRGGCRGIVAIGALSTVIAKCGLSGFAQGFAYDPASDSYQPVAVDVGGTLRNRELAPLFEEIFRHAPALPQGMAITDIDNPVLDYLTGWNELLWQIYPDYRPSGAGNLLGGTVAIDQAYIMQMLVAAYEAVPVGLDLQGVAHALSVDETRIRTHAAGATTVDGTSGVDFFVMGAGNQTYNGGGGADYYIVGKGSGNDKIIDVDSGANDELRFTDVYADQSVARRVGQDLVLRLERLSRRAAAADNDNSVWREATFRWVAGRTAA